MERGQVLTEYLDSAFLCDCEIQLYADLSDDQPCDVIRAHRVVLANSSDFFYNSFTSGMQESATGIVKVCGSSPSAFRSVIRWMYGGTFDYDRPDALNLAQVCHDWSVSALEQFFVREIQAMVSLENIIDLLAKCFDEKLPDALALLEPFLAGFIREIDIARLSDACDVATFAAALGHSNLANKEKVAMINRFLADEKYQTTQDDRTRLIAAMDKKQPLKQYLNPKWRSVHPPMYRALRF
jgi:hypothetical protein